MSAYIRTTIRRARIRHYCNTGGYACTPIMPGELYLEHVAAPGHTGIGNRYWLRLAECGPCAGSFGRPITTPQTAVSQRRRP
jgi:hypothetical protein